MKYYFKTTLIISILLVASGVAWAQSSVGASIEKQANAIVLIYDASEKEPQSLGLGFLIKSDGTFATNHHLVDGRQRLMVKLMDGDVYTDISLLDSAPIRDLTILKLKGFDMDAVNVGNSKGIKVGDKISVIDMGETLKHKIVYGEIVGTGSNETGFKYFEISMEVTPARSGSAVFNASGEAIGIANSMTVSGEKLNIAMPINYVRGMKLDAEPLALSKKGEQGVPVFGTKTPVDNRAGIQELNSLVSIFYTQANQLLGISWFYRHRGNVIEEKNPIIFQAADRFKELTRDAGKFRKETPMDEELGKIFDEYGYLFAKVQKNTALMITSRDIGAMDYAGVSVENVRDEDIAEANRALKKYVEENHPDLAETLMDIIIKGPPPPKPHNPNAAYGIQIAAAVRGAMITEGDGKYFRTGDVVLGVEGGEDFEDDYDFLRFLCTLNPKDVVRYRILRNGKDKVLKTKISKR